MPLSSRVTHPAGKALVTGASRGIGKAIAVALAGHGFDVAVAARTVRAGDATAEHSQSVHKQDTRTLPGSVEETAAEIERIGSAALALRLDLTDLASVDAAMTVLLERWGGVDVVVNNGRHIGPGLMDTILDTPIEQYPLFLTAHGVAPIRIAQRLLPGMVARGTGTFVTVSSTAGYVWYPPRPRPGLGYRIGKAAGHTLAGSLQAEHGGDGVRAFNINPGFTRTERNSLDAAEFGFDQRHACPPQAVAAAVAWLVTAPDADALQRENIEAQELVLARGLYPDWRGVLP